MDKEEFMDGNAILNQSQALSIDETLAAVEKYTKKNSLESDGLDGLNKIYEEIEREMAYLVGTVADSPMNDSKILRDTALLFLEEKDREIAEIILDNSTIEEKGDFLDLFILQEAHKKIKDVSIENLKGDELDIDKYRTLFLENTYFLYPIAEYYKEVSSPRLAKENEDLFQYIAHTPLYGNSLFSIW